MLPTCVTQIKAGKGILDDILRIGAVQLLAEHGEEHCEVDGAWGFHHHGV